MKYISANSGVRLRIYSTKNLTYMTLLHLRYDSLDAVNKQLNDKERVAAALENPNLVDMVDECLAPTYG